MITYYSLRRSKHIWLVDAAFAIGTDAQTKQILDLHQAHMKGALFGGEATYRNMFGSFLPGSEALGFLDGEFYKPIGPLADKLNRAAPSADPMEGLLSNISRVLRQRQNASYLVVSGQVTCTMNGATLVLRSLPDSVRDGIINWGCA